MLEANLGYMRPCLKRRLGRERKRKKMSHKSIGSQEANLVDWVTRSFEGNQRPQDLSYLERA